MLGTKTTVRTKLVSTITEIYKEVGRAEDEHASLSTSASNLMALQSKVLVVLERRTNAIADVLAKAVSASDLAKVPSKIIAIEKSCNSKLLKLQINMQRENRLFTSVSNVLKTRHDTVKNSIGNIR